MYDESDAEFHVTVTSDDSTPVTVRWYQVGSRTPIVSKTGRVNVTVSQNGTMLSFTVRANDTEGWALLTGDYECHASNGYSSQVAEFSLTIDPPPAVLFTTSAGNVVSFSNESFILRVCDFVFVLWSMYSFIQVSQTVQKH